MKDTIYLFDGSAFIFRAFFATPRLTNSEGFPTNALYGFTRMVLKFLRDVAPEHALMVFDAGAKTFRNEIYKEYKANRSECPEDLVPQMPHFRTISKALGFPVVELPGYEADDIIGTLTKALTALSHNVVIVSADKDLMQLVTDKVSMWDTMRDKRYGPDQVVEKLGVRPEQVIDYLAIAGDSSDNIPGLRGAGPKTAVQLVTKYGSVENILNSVSEIREDKDIRSRNKIAETLEGAEEILKLSKELVTIRCDAPVEFTHLVEELGEPLPPCSEELELTHLVGVDHVDQLLHLLEYRGSQKESLEEVVHRFDFESLVEEYGLDSSPEPQVALKQDYELVLKKDFTEWRSLLASKKIFSFDLETTSLDVHKAEIVGFACCFDDEKAYYVPCGHVERADDQITKEELCEALKAILENPEVKKVGQNLKYDVEVLLTHGVHVRGVWFDTMIAAYLLHPDTGGYGLTQLAKEHLRYEMIEYHEVVQDGQLFSDVSLAEAVAYAAEDAHIAWLLYEKFAPLIEKYELKRVCYEVENPLIEVLAAVEHFGMRLDSTLLESMSKDVAIQLRDLEGRIYGEAECEFNLNSPKQIGEVLFDKLGISTQGVKKTKTGYSTNQAVLEKLADEHPVPALILEYRGLHKLKSTYLDSLPKEVSEVTGRLHTRLNQTIAATGRLSSSEPNLQNIPIQTELGRRVRAAFIPSEGSLLISADYSQIELRLLAHLSGDEALIDSFRHGIDIHERTAREVLDIPEGETVTSEQRRLGKTMNFGIVYGMSGFRLARELGISVGEGNAYIERYFGRYPKVQQYFDSLEKQMEESGEVRTLLGRRRVISEIEQGARDRNFVKRAAMNAPLQGSAADLIKLAMIRMDKIIREESLPLTMVLQVHDELLFELSMNSLVDGDVQTFKLRIQQEMEGVMELSVPLSVGISSGDNWEEAHS